MMKSQIAADSNFQNYQRILREIKLPLTDRDTATQ